MKCDELQYERLGEANWAYPASTLVIRKQFVDEAVAELKDIAENACLECDDNQTAIDELEDERRWRNVDDEFPTADEGYILVLWEDGLPDIGYIGAEDDVIETVRDRGEGHSVEWWMPLPSAPKEDK